MATMDVTSRTRKVTDLNKFVAAIAAASSVPVNIGSLVSTSAGVKDVGEGANYLALFPTGFSATSKSVVVVVVGLTGKSGDPGVELGTLTFNSAVTNTKSAASAYGSPAQSVDLLGFRYVYFVIASITTSETVDLWGFGY